MPAIAVVGLAFVLLAGAIHILIFTLESVVWRTRGAATFGVEGADIETVRPWAFNQGWYNLFLALGALVGGVAALTSGTDALRIAGLAIAAFSALVMLGASIVLIATSREQLRGALIQGLAPLVGLVLIAVGWQAVTLA